MKRTPLLEAAVALLLATSTARAGAEIRIAGARMPNRLIPQAEVSLVRRGDDTIVRSVIHTRYANRVFRKIDDSEAANWSDRPDAAAYRAALKEAFAHYAKVRGGAPETALVIEFAAAPEATRVEFLFARVIRRDDAWSIEPAAPWKTLVLSRDYVEANQRLILEDAMGSEAQAAFQELQEKTPAIAAP